jgi:hypothetical protein
VFLPEVFGNKAAFHHVEPASLLQEYRELVAQRIGELGDGGAAAAQCANGRLVCVPVTRRVAGPCSYPIRESPITSVEHPS